MTALNTLTIAEARDRLLALTPSAYTGNAAEMAAAVVYRFSTSLVALHVITGFELDRAKRVLRTFDLIRVAGGQTFFRGEPCLLELPLLHQGPGELRLELRRVELVVTIHQRELLVVVLEIAMGAREPNQNARMPTPRLALSGLCAFCGFEELEGKCLVKESFWEVRFAVVLRHAEHQVGHVRARVLRQVGLGVFTCPYVPLTFDELPKRELLCGGVLPFEDDRGDHLVGARKRRP